MAELNDKLITYGNLSTFHDNLINDATGTTGATWSSSKIASEIANIPQLEAGKNVSIEGGKINAKGYFYDDEPKTELKLIDDIIHEAGMPPQASVGLKVSGVAGATTYTYTDNYGGTFAQIVQMGLLPGVGATYQTANGKSGVIAALDATTITFEETLDVDNALTDEPVDYIVSTSQLFSFAEGIYDYVEGDIAIFGLTLSGAAGATTYAYSTGMDIKSLYGYGAIFKLQDGRSAKSISLDDTNHTITFESTFDADNALSDALVITITKKNIASGKYSHVEGGMIAAGIITNNIASGIASHAEGVRTTASGFASHAEGCETTASGEASHAEGRGTASGNYSHAEGTSTASGEGSHAEGYYIVVAQNLSEHAEGTSNVSHKASESYGNAGNTQHSVGIGGNGGQGGKNAFEIMQNGDMYVLGVGGYQGKNTKVQDASIKTLQEYIASLEARIAALENPNA